MEGVSGCLFAYGISGSGKTFSLLGSQEAPGVLPRLARELLEAKCKVEEGDSSEECSVKAAFLELYNENLVDLLSDSREPLRLFESSREGVLVPGLSEVEVGTPDEFSDLMGFAARGRSVGATCVNAHSSRSHMLIQLRVQRTGRECATRAKIHVIDLAGSERQKRARSEGTRMKEGIHINVSLSALGLVISRLSEIAQGRSHCSVPFRDSKLTFLLKDSLSGNARTQVLVALSPGSSSYEESLSSLRFAQSVKRIRTRAVADVVALAPTGSAISQRGAQALQAEVDRLRAELRTVRACFLGADPEPETLGAGIGGFSQPESQEATGCGEAVDEAIQRLEGRYLSPSGRPIEVLPDGRVHFLGGNGHHPIRILPAECEEGGGSCSGSLRLESEGDPAYRYRLASEEEDGALVWRLAGHRDLQGDEESEPKEVRWQRSYGAQRRPSTFQEPDAELAQAEFPVPEPAGEVLREAQLAGRQSRALARLSHAVPALAKALRPAAALEVIEALVSLCAELDEANSVLERGERGAVQAPDTARLEATWLPPELNQDAPACELLHVRATLPQAAGAAPEAQRAVWPLAEFRRRLEAMRAVAGLGAVLPEEEDPHLLRRRTRSFWGLGDGLGHAQGSRAGSPGPPPIPLQGGHTGSPGPPLVPLQGSRAGSPGPPLVPLQGSRTGSPAPGAAQAQATAAAGVVPRAWSPVPQGGGDVRPSSLEPPQGRLAAARASRARRNSGSPSPSAAWPLLGSPQLQRVFQDGRSPSDPAPGAGQLVGEFHHLRGWYRSKSGVAIQVYSDGRVDFGGGPLQLSREGAKVLLRSPEDAEYGPYRLLGRDNTGVLRWDIYEDAHRGEAEGAAPAADVGEASSPITWTPMAVPVGAGQAGGVHGAVVASGEDEALPPQQRRSSGLGFEGSPRIRPLALPLPARGSVSGVPGGGSTPGTVLSAGRFGRQPFAQHGQRPRSADPCRGRGRSRAALAARERPAARRQRSPTPGGLGMSAGAPGGPQPPFSDRRAQSATSVRPKLGVAAGTGDPSVAARAIDKNSLRLRNGSIFVDALARWRGVYGHLPSAPQRRLLPGTCSVYVRKRPMFERDSRRCDFDVLTVVGSAAEGGAEGTAMGQEIVHHTCMFDRSLVTPLVMHTQFPFDGVFDADASNEGVYNVVGRPLLENALEGNLATLFVFGQTGSGKTYTMRHIERMAAEELFGRLDEGSQVSLTYFELAGRKALDLLTDQKTEIRLREEEDGCFRPHDCEEALVGSADELLRIMGEAASRRATDATTVNSSSSRSHAVCRISILRERGAPGRLLLVDCAGTERSRDTLYFKGQNVKESAEINSSLFALKDCIRSRQAAVHRQGSRPQDGVPLKLPSVRATPLTKVLAESLISTSAQLAAIATVSPNATDAEHTIDTLRTVYTLSGRGERAVAESRQILE
uniref:Kinesin motor domain-containing protein n=1 Tax=Alexandrium monilatum TaxID=311494 RepID=A0A7S4RRJ6_9DINO